MHVINGRLLERVEQTAVEKTCAGKTFQRFEFELRIFDAFHVVQDLLVGVGVDVHLAFHLAQIVLGEHRLELQRAAPREHQCHEQSCHPDRPLDWITTARLFSGLLFCQ